MKLKVKEIMKKTVHVIGESNSLLDALKIMQAYGCSTLFVERNNRVIGMINDHDIAIKLSDRGRKIGSMPVAAFMSTDVEYCNEDDPMEHACRLLMYNKKRVLGVLNRAHAFVGVLVLDDLLNSHQWVRSTYKPVVEMSL